MARLVGAPPSLAPAPYATDGMLTASIAILVIHATAAAVLAVYFLLPIGHPSDPKKRAPDGDPKALRYAPVPPASTQRQDPGPPVVYARPPRPAAVDPRARPPLYSVPERSRVGA